LKRLLLVWLALSLLLPVISQDILDFLPKEPPKTAKQNTGLLFSGLGLQLSGLAISAGSVYVMTQAWEDDMDLYLSGFGFGLTLAAAGTAMVIVSIHNMAMVRRSYRDVKKDKKNKGVTLQIEPTRYGVGLVCRF
jgi:hypothetical protein